MNKLVAANGWDEEESVGGTAGTIRGPEDDTDDDDDDESNTVEEDAEYFGDIKADDEC